MEHYTDGTTKKRLIALLLLISSAICVVMLLYSSDVADQRLQSFAQADSLIQNTLQQFNIDRNQIRVGATSVDSNLVRKTYTIRVPPGFSKTLLHAELNRTFHPLEVRTPASVSLPENQMTIQLTYSGTVFRTLRLQTDDELVLDRNYASLLVAFEEAPTPELVKDVIRFGEPVPIALRAGSAEQARERFRSFRPYYPYVCYWIDATGSDSNKRTPLPPAGLLEDLPQDASVLSFEQTEALSTKSATVLARTATGKNLTFIDVSDAVILDSDLGETFFKQELDKFATRARRQEQPVAIVIGDEEALQWLYEKLTVFKKSGLYLIHPPQITF